MDDNIIRYYSSGDRGRRLLEAAMRTAPDPRRLTTDDLSSYDEMHVGGRPATLYLLDAMNLRPGMKVLDIGSGLGGPARCAAERYDVTVTGIDLTPEFCETATILSEKTGLAGKVEFRAGSALDMPFGDAEFDAAYTIHAAMNIADRPALYREARRILKPGALFGVYDIIGTQGPDFEFPVPWSADERGSFLATAEETEHFLTGAGFSIIKSESRREKGLRSLHARRDRDGASCSPKILNLIRNIEEVRCEPWQIICRG